MTLTDKEKIKHLLVDIDSFLVEKGGDDVIVNWDGQTPRSLLEFIKKDLEKMTMNDQEKLEVVLKIIREKGGDSYNYSPSLLLGEIRKILES